MFFIRVLLLMEPTGKSEKSEPQMGFEPTTLLIYSDALSPLSYWRLSGDYGKGEMWVSNFPERSISNNNEFSYISFSHLLI